MRHCSSSKGSKNASVRMRSSVMLCDSCSGCSVLFSFLLCARCVWTEAYVCKCLCRRLRTCWVSHSCALFQCVSVCMFYCVCHHLHPRNALFLFLVLLCVHLLLLSSTCLFFSLSFSFFLFFLFFFLSLFLFLVICLLLFIIIFSFSIFFYFYCTTLNNSSLSPHSTLFTYLFIYE